MALPSSGQISMNDIRIELGVPSQSPFGLNEARNGTYVTLNPSSPTLPPSTGQVSLSSWYGYSQTGGGSPTYNFQAARGTTGGTGTACSNAAGGLWFTTLYSYTDTSFVDGNTYYNSSGVAYNGGNLYFSDGASYGRISTTGVFTYLGACTI